MEVFKRYAGSIFNSASVCAIRRAAKQLTNADHFLLNCSLVLTDLLDAMHNIRDKFEIKSHCQCTSKQNMQAGKLPAMNGVSQVSLKCVCMHSSLSGTCGFLHLSGVSDLHTQWLGAVVVFYMR